MSETETLREVRARACAVMGPSAAVALAIDGGIVSARESFDADDGLARAGEELLVRIARAATRARVGVALTGGRRIVFAVSRPGARRLCIALAVDTARACLPRHRRWALGQAVAAGLGSPAPRDALVRAAIAAAISPDAPAVDVAPAALAAWTIVERFEAGDLRYVVARCGGALGAGVSALSPRERDVLGRVASGHASKRIAIELEITEQTVATHVARIRAKLGIDTRMDLIRTFAGAIAHASAA